MKEVAEQNRERRTAVLSELVQQAGLAPDLDHGLSAAIRLTEQLFGVRAALLLRRPDHTMAEQTFSTSSFSLDAKERSAAEWAFRHRAPAGKFPETLQQYVTACCVLYWFSSLLDCAPARAPASVRSARSADWLRGRRASSSPTG